MVAFDPKVIAYDELLAKFWSTHDPARPSKPESQYRAVAFHHTDDQKRAATASRDNLRAKLGKEIGTEIAPAGPFWRAEEYHQQFQEGRGAAGCRIR